MTYIDSVILDLTERACRRFQMLTGRTNVWLAGQLTNLSIIVYFLSAPVLFVNFNGRLLAPFHFHLQLVGLSYSLIVLTTVVLYVLACDPLPPCAGKVREWLRGLVPSRIAPSMSDLSAGD